MQQLTTETVMAIWNAAVEACAIVAENCEPDDHGYLSVHEIAETVERECSIFAEDSVCLAAAPQPPATAQPSAATRSTDKEK